MSLSPPGMAGLGQGHIGLSSVSWTTVHLPSFLGVYCSTICKPSVAGGWGEVPTDLTIL